MGIINKIFITNSFEETGKLGKDFARSLLARPQGETLIIALYGDLGSGKTTFAQGLAEGLGIKKRIISPTFIIVRSYELQTQNSKLKIQNYNSKLKSLEPKKFYHVDLYRINSKQDIEGLGIEEIINDNNSIVVIEWAEKMGKLLPKNRIDVKFEYVDENRRKINIVKVSS